MIIKKNVDGKKYKVMFFSPDDDWKYTLSQISRANNNPALGSS